MLTKPSSQGSSGLAVQFPQAERARDCRTTSHYRVVEKLWEGGMGVVYENQAPVSWLLIVSKHLPSRLIELGTVPGSGVISF